jgi:uncharacterized protein involved in exopolysaccharide biosynthesis
MGGAATHLYLGALRTWWWAGLAVPVLAVGSALYLTGRQARVYRAEATVAVMPAPEITNPAEVMRGLETLERRTVIATLASMAGTREARYDAAGRLGLHPSDVAGYRVQASVLPSTNIIRITVQGGDGERVSLLANELLTVLAGRVREMYRVFAMEPLEVAQPARQPFHPDPVRNSTTAGVVGMFLGLLLTLLLEFLRARRAPQPGGIPAVRVEGAREEVLTAAWGTDRGV